VPIGYQTHMDRFGAKRWWRISAVLLLVAAVLMHAALIFVVLPSELGRRRDIVLGLVAFLAVVAVLLLGRLLRAMLLQRGEQPRKSE
jgi:hypothetical protein